MKIKAKFFFLSLIISNLIFFSYLYKSQDDDRKVFINSFRNEDIHKFEKYNFNPKMAIIARVKAAPDFLINYFKKMDKRNDYITYIPDEREMKVIYECIKLLPRLNREIIDNKVLGIFFLDNYKYTAWTEIVVNKSGGMYFIIIVNAAVLKNNISDWLTYKENTCFIHNQSDTIMVKIDCGTKLNAFLYALLHETTHAVDCVKNITPYTDEIYRMLLKNRLNKNYYVKEIWEKYQEPVEKYEAQHRKDVSFYGLNNGPKINISDSVNIYQWLSQTPFVSLYGSKSWAEDIAELLTFYHITHILNQPYFIRIYINSRMSFSYEPMKSARVLKRIDIIKKFY